MFNWCRRTFNLVVPEVILLNHVKHKEDYQNYKWSTIQRIFILICKFWCMRFRLIFYLFNKILMQCSQCARHCSVYFQIYTIYAKITFKKCDVETTGIVSFERRATIMAKVLFSCFIMPWKKQKANQNWWLILIYIRIPSPGALTYS